MKCAKCGAEIKKGHLYCSSCGAEVQIVSAANVLEEELFLDFQRREMSGDAGHSKHGQTAPRKISQAQKKKWTAGWIVSVAGVAFLVLLAIACSVGDGQSAKTQAADVSYDQLIRLLAEGDEDGAAQLLADGAFLGEDSIQTYAWQAWLEGQCQDTDGQLLILKKALAQDPENAYFCQAMIRIFVDQQDFDGLYDFYESCQGSSLEKLFSDYLVEAPQILLPEGVFLETDTLTITAQDGLNIYYTTDGSSPVTDGILYCAPLEFSAGDYTLSAAACNDKGYYSPVVTCALTVESHEKPAMPYVTPESGEYQKPQTIYITVPEGCTAYYTWNGQTPTTASARYSGGISMPEGNNVLSVMIIDAYGYESSIQRMNYIYMPQ